MYKNDLFRINRCFLILSGLQQYSFDFVPITFFYIDHVDNYLNLKYTVALKREEYIPAVIERMAATKVLQFPCKFPTTQNIPDPTTSSRLTRKKGVAPICASTT